MGTNQEANWCVSYPWFDWILGTRVRSEPKPARKSRRKSGRVPSLAPLSTPRS
jgi:hypothetical protein